VIHGAILGVFHDVSESTLDILQIESLLMPELQERFHFLCCTCITITDPAVSNLGAYLLQAHCTVIRSKLEHGISLTLNFQRAQKMLYEKGRVSLCATAIVLRLHCDSHRTHMAARS